jgi:hypothetical protein
MIRRFAKVAFAAALLGACQSMPMPQMFGGGGPRGPSIDGRWASGDGISVTTFAGGQLTTRYVGTNEVLGQGTYTVAGNQATMNWVSRVSQQNRSATCTFTSPTTLRCSPAGGQAFTLTRTA